MTRKKMAYSPEFRLEANQLIVDQCYKIKAACDAMGIGNSTLENRVKSLRKERQGAGGKGAPFKTFD